MERFRLRPLLLLLAIALSALAAGWYFADGDETVEVVESETAPIVSLGEEEASRGPQMRTSAVTTTSGLQGTVPDTVGQNEATATPTLEGAGTACA